MGVMGLPFKPPRPHPDVAAADGAEGKIGRSLESHCILKGWDY